MNLIAYKVHSGDFMTVDRLSKLLGEIGEMHLGIRIVCDQVLGDSHAMEEHAAIIHVIRSTLNSITTKMNHIYPEYPERTPS